MVDGYLNKMEGSITIHFRFVRKKCSSPSVTKLRITAAKDMIIVNHGVLQFLVISCTLISAHYAKSTKEMQNGKIDNNSETDTRTKVENNVRNVKELDVGKNATGIINSQRRAHRYDIAGSSPWVRVYNRPPGTQTESFYNYETRGNTSAHTNGEIWNTAKDDFPIGKISPIGRSDANVKDFLRVKPKSKEPTQANDQKGGLTTEAVLLKKSVVTSTKTPEQVTTESPTTEDNNKKGYIIWKSSDAGSNEGWTLDNEPESYEDKSFQPTIENMIPQDGSHWKVIGEGGEEGWQVIDDKGDIEWKIEYDDGEWRVTSTGEVPADAEWINPEYIWTPTDNSASEEQENKSWPSDDYRVPHAWTYPELSFSGINNDTVRQIDYSNQAKIGEIKQTPESTEWKTKGSDDSKLNQKNFQFGARRKLPSKSTTTSSAEERTDSSSSATVSDEQLAEKTPHDQQIIDVKSWVPRPVANGGQEWIQGYGSKTWNGDDSGWNVEVGGETWLAAGKNYDPWVPKVPESKVTVISPKVSTTDAKDQDHSVRAWGTGYGSKTWKGKEWDSNIVWKTGYNTELPRSVDNNTWKFPETRTVKKKPQVWSQPIRSSGDISDTNRKTPSRNLERVRVKWSGQTTVKGNSIRKVPPRRTGGESWVDDTSVGGVVWKKNSDDNSTKVPQHSKSSNQDNKWKNGNWKIHTHSKASNPTTAPRKTYKPPKSSNLISLTWNAGGHNPLDSVPALWNQGQWIDSSGRPTWTFEDCKLTLKCGPKVPDTADDSRDRSNPPNAPNNNPSVTTTIPPYIGKGWSVRQKSKKSWKSPQKSWKPPKWKQSTPSPTPETMPPTIMWKSPPSAMWKQPPSTIIWTETTAEPPTMSWKPQPPSSSSIRWRKGPKPTKTWKPPPTKSWKPPRPHGNIWQPAIATPQPDTWPTTKPHCKDTTVTTQFPTTKLEDDSNSIIEPPRIILLTKLPEVPYHTANDKKDGSEEQKKLTFGPWVFPPRKIVPKSSNSRRDKIIPISKPPPRRSTKIFSKPINTLKGWPRGMPPPHYIWPNNNMRRWTTKKSQMFSTFKYPKFSKPKTWRQMFRKWMNGR